MPSTARGWVGWLLLAWSGGAGAEVLYRCVGGEGIPRWQDTPCAAGERQRALEYSPEPRAHAPVAPAAQPAPAGRQRSAPPRARPRAARDPRHDRAMAACREARVLAAERTDIHGDRVPVRVIRERERLAGRACRR